MRQLIKIITTISICLLFSAYVLAQQSGSIISGKVTDVEGEPLAGIKVSSDYDKDVTMTDKDGKYTLSLSLASERLLFSSLGYKSVYGKIAGAQLDMTLNRAESNDKDEIIYLGHSAQRKKDISGAISTVTGEELAKSPVANLSMALAGRLPGIFSNETNSELSRASTSINVRGASSVRGGQPIVVVDGMVIGHNTIETFDYITADEIETVTLLKDAASLAIYGIQGADGVLVITTKRGVQGKLKIGVKLDQTFQQMSTTPSFINSADYAKMRNQAAANDGLGSNYYFNDNQIAGFESGTDGNLYPNNNWRKEFMKDITSMQRVGVNLSGGGENVLYYSNVNMMHQDNFYNTDQTAYNPSNHYLWVNFRSNVDAKINKYLSASLRLAGNIKREKTPGGGFLGNIYPTLFQIPSSIYGPTTPEGGVVVTDKVQATPYGLINRSGFSRHTVTNIYAQFALNLDLGFWIKGLSMSGSYSYQTNSVNSLNTRQEYEKWIRKNDDTNLSFNKYGTDVDTPLRYEKASSMYYQLTYHGMMNYKRDFGKHQIGAMAYAYYQDLIKGDVTMPLLLPYMKIVSGAEVTYGFDNRYLLKLDMGYSGSEQYAPGNRFVFTPAVSATWTASNEAFLEDATWLSNLKVRAAYGKTATENSGLGRFSYLDNIVLGNGGTISSLGYLVTEAQVANPDIRPEISKKLNFGADIGLFDNLSLSFDYFKDKMDNMVIHSGGSLPAYQGVPLDYLPASNSGVFENKGYELTLAYTKDLNRDLSFSVGGSVLHAKNKVIKGGEAIKDDDYAYRKWQEGYSLGQEFGYLINKDNGSGFYNSREEIDRDNLQYEIGTPRIGDLRYKDLNNDGIINEKDKAPIGTGSLPRYYYSIFGQAKYKSFDFSVLFQGVGKYYTTFSGAGVFEYDLDGVFGSLHRNAWTQERYQNGETIDYPALSTQKNINHETNDFFLYNRSYLRLKNIEIGYTFPAKWSNAIFIENLRLSVSAQNLLTWDSMKSSDFGPEGGGYLSIPVYRFYNVKLNLSF